MHTHTHTPLVIDQGLCIQVPIEATQALTAPRGSLTSRSTALVTKKTSGETSVRRLFVSTPGESFVCLLVHLPEGPSTSRGWLLGVKRGLSTSLEGILGPSGSGCLSLGDFPHLGGKAKEGMSLGDDSPFFSTIVLFNNQPFSLGFRRFSGKKDPRKEWKWKLPGPPQVLVLSSDFGEVTE